MRKIWIYVFIFDTIYLLCSMFDIIPSRYNTRTDWCPGDFIYWSVSTFSVCMWIWSKINTIKSNKISLLCCALKCVKPVLPAPQITLNLEKSCNTTPDGLILFNLRKSCSHKNLKVSCSADNIIHIIRRIWDGCYVGGLPKRLIAFFSPGSRVCLPNPAGTTVTQGKTGISDSSAFD